MFQVFQKFVDMVPFTASDTQDLPAGTTQIYVGSTGDLTVDIWDQSRTTTLRTDITWKNIPAASLIPAANFRKIRAKTTCGNMIALIGD